MELEGRGLSERARSIALGAFAGLVAGGYAVGVAFMLDVSPVIAGTTTALVTAVIVALVRYRHGPADGGRVRMEYPATESTDGDAPGARER